MELLRWGAEGWGDELVRSALMTLAVSVASFALGLLIGGGGAFAKLSHSRLLRLIAEVYTTVVRGIPELLVIYLLYFGSSLAIMRVLKGVFGYEGRIELNAFTIGMVAVGIVSGAYSTEVIRGAFQSVPKGQLEAAVACGMSPWLRFRRVLLPLAARYALPGLGNVWQLTLKDTALISVTGLVEIMRQAELAAGATRQPFVFYLTAAALYLVFTTVSNWGFHRAEAYASRGVRR
jgi:octopine/nopaline transport system permease protein